MSEVFEKDIGVRSLYKQLIKDIQDLSPPVKHALHSLYEQFSRGTLPQVHSYKSIINDDTQSLISIDSECGVVTACFGCNYRDLRTKDNGANKNATEHLVKWEAGALFAWCIWDAFFIVRKIGKPAKISSIDPINKDKIEINFDGFSFDTIPLWFSFPLGSISPTNSIRSCFCCRTKAFTTLLTAKCFAKEQHCEVVELSEILRRTDAMVEALKAGLMA